MNYQSSLFGHLAEQNPTCSIPGLVYFPSLLNLAEQNEILEAVDCREWNNELKRRVQHYGYSYDYKSRRVFPSSFLGELPPFATRIVLKLMELKLLLKQPDQLIVNEYLPGQGISAHIDCVPCFENQIAMLSLGWAYEMDFIRVSDQFEQTTLLEPGSVVVIADQARYEWLHRIKARKCDRGVYRQRRVSLTFRKVIL